MRLAQGMLIGHWVGSVLRTDILMTVAQLICKIYSWESSKQTEIRTSNIELKKYGAQEKRELAFPIKNQYKLADSFGCFFFSAHRIELLTLVRIRPIIRCKPFKGTLS